MIRRFRAVRAGGEQGVALVMVLGITMVLVLLVGAAVSMALGNQRQGRYTQDWNAALAAAYAGVEEYQSRLANDTEYFRYGNPAAPYSVDTGSTVIMPVEAAAQNPAFGVGAGGSWAEVAGSDGAAQFRYEVDNSDYYGDGTLRLRATGRAGGETRSIVADLRQKGFIEFLYFTDLEIMDPRISGDSDDCAVYRYANRPAGCGTINFITADTFNGPLHTNDMLQICGSPKFLGTTSSSYTSTGQRYAVGGGCGNSPVFAMSPGNPVYQPVLAMPETNAELRKETNIGDPEVPSPGCMYTGPTKITLYADGTMRVKSPWTKYTAGNAASNVAGCGTPGASGLAAADGQVVDQPANNVVFVQNVPTSTSDANFWATGAPGTPACLPADRRTSSGRPFEGNPVGYPAAGEYVDSAGEYGCRNGDIFVEGTVDGRMTFAAENYIYITNDVRYEDAEDDMLGLVGQNAVFVYKPERQSSTVQTDNNNNTSEKNTLVGQGWDCWPDGSQWDCRRYTFSGNGNDLVTNNGRRIDAALLSVARTFQVQNYNLGGNRGTLTINGALAQKFRGTVGTGSAGSVSTGYAKNYQYDQRFRYTGPPKFLSPVSTTYGVSVWVEVEPAYTTGGETR